MKYYFDGKEKLEIGEFLFNYLNNELVLSERDQKIAKEILVNSSRKLFGQKTIKPNNVSKIHPYDESDTDRLSIDLNEIDPKSNTEKHLAINLKVDGNGYSLKVYDKHEIIIGYYKNFTERGSEIISTYSYENTKVQTCINSNGYTKMFNKDNNTEISVSIDTDEIALDKKRSAYSYLLCIGDNKPTRGLISITGKRDTKGYIDESEIVRRLNIIFDTITDPSYKKQSQRHKK